jgi:hypothetical protein
MDNKLVMTDEDIWIVSTIEFSSIDIRRLENWVVQTEIIMMVTCPWFPHVASGKSKKVQAKFKKIYCEGKCYIIFSDSFRSKKCPCWVHDIDYVIEVVKNIIETNPIRPWHERFKRWLNGIIPM